MATLAEIEGTEFDWFAVDRSGKFALFATAGYGPVPASVLASADAHTALGEIFEVEGWGTQAVWQSYSRVGLYVYDWSPMEHRYVRAAEPLESHAPALEARLSECPSVFKLEGVSFAQAEAIRPDWLDEA